MFCYSVFFSWVIVSRGFGVSSESMYVVVLFLQFWSSFLLCFALVEFESVYLLRGISGLPGW